MKYIRTNLATDWKQNDSLSIKILKKLLWFIPKANPNYEGKLHLVKEWLIEFDDVNLPWREIGLDNQGIPVLAGPSKSDYGFWLDTNMTLSDFDEALIEASVFESLWSQSGVEIVT